MPSQLKRKGVDGQVRARRAVKRQHAASSTCNHAPSHEIPPRAKLLKAESEAEDTNLVGNGNGNVSHSRASSTGGQEARQTIEPQIKREREDSATRFCQTVTPESCNGETEEQEPGVAARASRHVHQAETLARLTTPAPKKEESPDEESKGKINAFPEASLENQDRHDWRRSAAPSPSASRQQHLSSTPQRQQQQQVIRAQDLGVVILQVLVPSSRNPNRCPCGWYQFYSLCGHLCQTEAFKCGARRSRSRVPTFCGSPAPRHNVETHVIEQACAHCAHSRTRSGILASPT